MSSEVLWVSYDPVRGARGHLSARTREASAGLALEQLGILPGRKGGASGDRRGRVSREGTPRAGFKQRTRGTLRAVLVCECAKVSSFDRRESENFGIRHPGHPPARGQITSLLGRRSRRVHGIKSPALKKIEDGHPKFVLGFIVRATHPPHVDTELSSGPSIPPLFGWSGTGGNDIRIRNDLNWLIAFTELNENSTSVLLAREVRRIVFFPFYGRLPTSRHSAPGARYPKSELLQARACRLRAGPSGQPDGTVVGQLQSISEGNKIILPCEEIDSLLCARQPQSDCHVRTDNVWGPRCCFFVA